MCFIIINQTNKHGINWKKYYLRKLEDSLVFIGILNNIIQYYNNY